jgi:hypothetical protein
MEKHTVISAANKRLTCLIHEKTNDGIPLKHLTYGICGVIILPENKVEAFRFSPFAQGAGLNQLKFLLVFADRFLPIRFLFIKTLKNNGGDWVLVRICRLTSKSETRK